jgi:Na+/glutamate symporter
VSFEALVSESDCLVIQAPLTQQTSICLMRPSCSAWSRARSSSTPRGPASWSTSTISRSFGAVAIALFLGLLMLTALRAIPGTDLFDRFPLFPFTIIGGFAVQLVRSPTGHEHLVERRPAAIGTLSLSTLARTSRAS